ncbi:DUF4280 domain-containing protein [Flavobacterium kingsejongi]|uniref:DUF4280 domain-containing protein n=1 Tax=Flavobacterium kingsejongi TaxID=1678728 RepID=A0A2S1LUJ9_9FLAO|nr:DUF4280 domain-containing protein [Flavobacterium kingsejongi]AWG27331.1 hypothetical protein FK004_12810 [Flavobacterium kingsejongi]
MSEKYVVVQGADCKCKFSVEPLLDKLLVKTQKKEYANDRDGAKKLIATDQELGQTLEKNTFGKCKLQPTPGGYLPCKAVITKWSAVYEAVTLSNSGKILLEDSKATCPIGGPECILIDKNGQKTEAGEQNFKNATEEVQIQINPLVDPKDMMTLQRLHAGAEDSSN